MDSLVILTWGDEENEGFIVLHKEVSGDADVDTLHPWARWLEEQFFCDGGVVSRG